MAKLVYGKKQQLQFQSEQDLYTSIGFLAKAKIRLYIEDNDVNKGGGEGAWAKEWRMSFSEVPSNIPQSLQDSIKTNSDGKNPRLNNKEFINDLLKNTHGFQLGDQQNIATIKATIPAKFVTFFDNGTKL